VNNLGENNQLNFNGEDKTIASCIYFFITMICELELILVCYPNAL